MQAKRKQVPEEKKGWILQNPKQNKVPCKQNNIITIIIISHTQKKDHYYN